MDPGYCAELPLSLLIYIKCYSIRDFFFIRTNNDFETYECLDVLKNVLSMVHCSHCRYYNQLTFTRHVIGCFVLFSVVVTIAENYFNTRKAK